MDLQEFVRESLCQAIKGVHEAQEELASSGGVVSPAPYNIGNGTKAHKKDEDFVDIIRFSFDVAITATEGKSNEKGGSLRVLSLSLGAEGKKESYDGTVSRIQFEVPVSFRLIPSASDMRISRM